MPRAAALVATSLRSQLPSPRSPLATRHSPLATRRSPPHARRSPLTTRHPPSFQNRPLDWDAFSDEFSHGRDCNPGAISLNCSGADLGSSCLPLYADAGFEGGLGEFDHAVCDAKQNLTSVCSKHPGGGVCTYFKSNPQLNVTSFDHFGSAFVTIFYSITLEGWIDVTYMLMSTTSPAISISYMVLLVFFGAFFVINLLLAVIFDKFDEIAAEERERASREARGSCRPKRAEARRAAVFHRSPSFNRATALVRARTDFLYKRGAALINSTKFDLAIIVIISANTLVMALDSTPPPFGLSRSKSDDFQSAANIVFTTLFILELALKLSCLGFRTWSASSGNIFDAVVVGASIVEMCVDMLVSDDENSNGEAFVVLTTLKVGAAACPAAA